MTEQQLIERCIQGDRSAQHQLYHRYSKAMYTTAYRISGDFEVAAEVLQDAFLQVFRHLADFEQRSTVGAWIKAIVVRTALRRLSRKKAPFLEMPENYAETSINWDAVPLDTEYLEKAINALPEGARAVFVLSEVEGYGHREIAEMLQISEGTSKSQLHYAKKSLRKILVAV